MLGAALAGQHKYAEAEPLLVSGFEGMVLHEAGMAASDRIELERAGARIVKFYQAWRKRDKAAEWRAKLQKDGLPNLR